MLTCVFKSGNALAVRMPKELGFVDAAQDVEVERVGNTLIVRSVERDRRNVQSALRGRLRGLA